MYEIIVHEGILSTVTYCSYTLPDCESVGGILRVSLADENYRSELSRGAVCVAIFCRTSIDIFFSLIDVIVISLIKGTARLSLR